MYWFKYIRNEVVNVRVAGRIKQSRSIKMKPLSIEVDENRNESASLLLKNFHKLIDLSTTCPFFLAHDSDEHQLNSYYITDILQGLD